MKTIDGGFIAECALSLLDAMWMFLPSPWRKLRIAGEYDEQLGMLRLASAEAMVEGDVERPAPLQSLRNRLNPFQWVPVASSALARIAEEVAASGIQWNGEKAEAEWCDDGSARLVLDGAEIRIPAALASKRLFTSELGALLDETMPAATERQNALARELDGLERWNFETSTSLLELTRGGRSEKVQVAVIASYASDMTFLWSWAHSQLSRLPGASKVAAVRDRYAGRPGLGAFGRAGFFCDEQFALIMALAAGAAMNARAVFPGRTKHMTGFFALP